MRLRHWLAFLLFLCLPVSLLAQDPDLKSTPERKGSILEGHIYLNPSLEMKITLPGSWHFFDMDAYETPESKAKLQAEIDRLKAMCHGPLCGDSDITVSLQSSEAGRPFHGLFMTAYKLSPEFQNRKRYTLRWFAEAMTAISANMGWVPEGEVTPIQLGGRPAYRLTMHNATTTSAKGFAYVADSNGFVFMLVATAVSEPAELQSAVESMKFEEATR